MANGDQATTTIDFSKYAAPVPVSTAGVAPTIDFSKYSNAIDSNAKWDELKDRYSLPHSVDLSKSYQENFNTMKKEDFNKMDVLNFSKAYAEANPPPPEAKGYLANLWGEAVGAFKGLTESEPTSTATPPIIPGVAAYEAGKQRIEQARTDLPGALGKTTADIGIAALPFLGEIWSKVSPTATIEQALGRRLSAAEADAARPGGQIQPALNNTPREVLQHASDEGIKLTPGQATEDAMAQNLQKAGTTAAIGGKELTSALNEQRVQFGKAINSFMDDVDPKRAGLSAENAGETIQRNVGVAKDVTHENASQGYQKINYLMDSKVQPKGISAAWDKVKENLPVGAEDQILAATPRSMRAVVEDLLSGKPEGFKPTFAQGIQLRKFFRDLGDTEGLPNVTQASYKQMSSAVDKAMEGTAKDLEATDDWRSANAGWKDYTQKYGDKQSVLYKIEHQQDPTRIVTTLQNAPATDILKLKSEGVNLDPLRRQVVQDIAQSRFNIGHDGLGGYSDQYLKSIFSPAEVKELYLKADLANRLKFDPNPSGTGANISSVAQLGALNQAKMSTAARLSMPKDPLSFLPPGAAIRTTPFTVAPYTLKTDSLGVQWAENQEGVRVSVPKGTSDAVIKAKLQEQESQQAALKQSLGIKSPVTGQPLATPSQLFKKAGNE